MPSSNISAAITHPLDGVVQSAKGFFESRLLGVIVFGSFVRGEATGSSDVDLLFVLNSSLVPTKSLYKEWDNFSGRVSDIGGLPVSVNFVTLPKSSAACGGVWLEVALEGAVLFDPTLSVNRFLIEVREEITSQRVTSRFAHGQRYWVWKREAA